MIETVNLYLLNHCCPKCYALFKICNSSRWLQNKAKVDFEIISVDPDNEQDMALQLLLEHNITNMPVLLVDNTFYEFNDAVKLIRERDNEIYNDNN